MIIYILFILVILSAEVKDSRNPYSHAGFFTCYPYDGKNTKEIVYNLTHKEFVVWRISLIFASILAFTLTYLFSLDEKQFFIIIFVSFSLFYFLNHNLWFHRYKPLLHDINKVVQKSQIC